MTPWPEVFLTLGCAVLAGIVLALIANIPIRRRKP